MLQAERCKDITFVNWNMSVCILKIHHCEPIILMEGQTHMMNHQHAELVQGYELVQPPEVTENSQLVRVTLGNCEDMG